jgi:hypothetical protein
VAEENLGRAVLALTTDDSGLERGLDDAERKTAGWAGRVGGVLKSGLLIGGAVAVAAGAAVVGILADSTKEAMAAERVTALLESTLKSTGGVAGMTRQSIEALSLSLSLVTPVEDDIITGAQTMLLTFKNIGKDIFPQTTESVLNMATAMNQGAIPSAEQLQSTAIMIGKALNDPIAGMAAMGRAGVQFSDGQKEAIKAMVETGNLAGAQAIILGELESQFGGAARAAGTTFAGQMAIANNQIGNIKEQIGAALIPVLSQLATQYGPQVIAFAQELANWLVVNLIPAISQLVAWLGVNLPPVIAFLATAWQTVLLPALTEVWRLISTYLIPALQTIWNWLAVNLPPAIEGAKKTWLELQPALLVINNVLNWIVDAIKLVIDSFRKASEFLMGLEIKNPFQGLLDTIEGIVGAAKRAIEALRGLAGANTGGGGTAGGGTPSGGAWWQKGGASVQGMAASNENRSYQNTWAITVNAPGGDPGQVRRAAEQGVLSAARAMGMR